MSQDPSCIFCKILRGEIPSARVLEADRVVAFLDVNPVNKGHVLIVPRDHYATLTETPAELAAAIGAELPRLGRAVLAATGAEGLNVIINDGRAAGQVIFHVHWHLIPRHRGDAVRWPWPHQSYQGDEREQLRARIARELAPAPG